MARKFLTSIDTGKNQFITPVMENLASAPSTPVKFQLYGNTTDNTLYWWDGAQWIAAKAAAGATPAGTVTTQAIGDTGTVGVSTNFAREDHKHGMPAFSGAVTPGTSFGLLNSVGSSVNLAHADHSHGTPAHNASEHSTIPLSALAAAGAAINMGGFKINNVGTPTSGTDAANKDYVDNMSAGLSWKDSCRIATTANVGLTGLAAIDGITPIANDRVLVKNQTAIPSNGIYLAASGAWTRATDADVEAELLNATVFVSEGTQADTAWVMTTNAPITVGTTNIVWVQFGAGAAITAGAGLTMTANTLDVVAADATITVAADSIARAALTGDVTTSVNAATIANNVVTNTKLATMPANTIKGNNTGSTANAADLTVAQLKTLLAFPGKYVNATVGGATSQVITHSLGTRDVITTVYRTLTPWDVVDCDIENTSTTTVTLRFNAAPAANEYSCVVVG